MGTKYVASVIGAIEQLPTHEIGGYEWECYSCHYHVFGRYCTICNIDPTKEQDYNEYDEKGNPCNHSDLISKALVLKLLGVEDEQSTALIPHGT